MYIIRSKLLRLTALAGLSVVLGLGAFAGPATASQAPAATQTHVASAAKPPPPGSPAWKRLSKDLLVAGDKRLMRDVSLARQGQLRQAGSWYGGYADLMNSGVSGRQAWTSFYVPAVNCNLSTYGSSGTDILYFWAGLDGNGLVQAGIEVTCTQGNPTPTYTSWIYICCQNNPFTVTPVVPRAGDQFSAVICAPNVCNGVAGFYMAVEDVTTGDSYSVARFCPSGLTCDNTAAEGIFELGATGSASICTTWDLIKFSWPNGNNGNYGATISSTAGQGTFTAKTGAWSSLKWTIADASNHVLSTTGNLFNGGQSYTETYIGC
jgi:hypothetical protein